MTAQDILINLPFAQPFLFVDEILSVDDEHIQGSYTLKEDEFFYAGHFPGNPVTPGVILTEIAAQIGLVSFGIYLAAAQGASTEKLTPLFSSSQIDFLKPVFPGERVTVHAKKEYFRFSKLKCSVTMLNDRSEQVLKGVLSGMMSSGDK